MCIIYFLCIIYQMNDILAKLGLTENLTQIVHKEKVFTKVKDTIPLKEDLNFMADLLFLPESVIGKQSYKYCLVLVDIASNEFDIEPIENKEPETILKAFKLMNKRKYFKIDKNSATLTTDAGNEFRGVVSKWLYDESIYHKIAIPNRHTQLSNLNYLCRQLGKVFNLYMNQKEKETGKVFRNWTDIVDKVREVLNQHRKIVLPKDLSSYQYPIFDFHAKPNKYKVGDIVSIKLDTPEDALGNKVSGKAREGDIRWSEPKKIERILYLSPPINYRYLVSGITNASFTEPQIRPSEAKQEVYKVKDIIDKKKEKGKVFYLIWWQGYKKEDATWEPRTSIIEDAPELVKNYEKSKK